jgi:hypothetical protein
MTWLKTHAARVVILLIVGLSILYLGGCPIRAPSPRNPSQLLTAAELHIELEHLLQLYELRQGEISEKQRIRTLIINNALTIASAPTLNPLGILTSLAGIYGLGSITKDTAGAIKRKIKPSTT